MTDARPTGLRIAVVTLVLAGLMALAFPFVDVGEVPQTILVGGLVMSALGLIAAWQLWSSGSRLGWWLGLLVGLIDGLGAAPGIVFAEDPTLRLLATVGTILRLATVVGLLWPSTRAVIGRSATD